MASHASWRLVGVALCCRNGVVRREAEGSRVGNRRPNAGIHAVFLNCRFIPRIRFTFRQVIPPTPVSSADTEYPRFAGPTMFLPLIVSIAPGTVTETQLLAPRRWEDQNNILWTTHQRIQENLIKGGLAGRTATGRQTHTRSVSGIDGDVKLNRARWVTAGYRRLCILSFISRWNNVQDWGLMQKTTPRSINIDASGVVLFIQRFLFWNNQE